jgi:hypothetical protein
MYPLFCTYYTDAYTQAASDLRDDLERLGLPWRIDKVPEFAAWDLATRYKPKFLREVMDSLSPCRCVPAVCWIDADARIEREPVMLEVADAPVDVMLHKWQGRETLSGLVWLAINATTRALLDGWERRNARTKTILEQRNLEYAITATGARVRYLPESYSYLEGLSSTDIVPVVRQAQLSRKTRVKN